MTTTGGWVALHRELLDSYLWALRPTTRVLAITILVAANWKPGETVSDGQRVFVKRGQLMTSLKSLSKLAGIRSISTIRTSLVNLEKLGFLTSTSTNRFRMITVTNYESYQSVDDDANRPTRKPLASRSQAARNDRTREQGNKGNQTEDLSFSLEADQPKPAKRSRGPRRDPAISAVVESVMEAFNKTFRRKLGSAGFYDVIERCLGAGYTDEQMRGVVWWAPYEWTEDHSYRPKLSPTTLFKLQGGNRTFPVYLELATEHWPKVYPGRETPWQSQ